MFSLHLWFSTFTTLTTVLWVIMIWYFHRLYNLYFQLLQYARKKRYYISRWNYIALCVESLIQLSFDDIAFCVHIDYFSGHKDRKGTLERIECFHSRGQDLCKFIGTKGSVCIRNEFNSHRIHWELVWDTNMAAVSLFWDTNMVAVTSCENIL